MPSTRVVSDSSFYIFFLDDIGCVGALLRILTCEDYSFVMGSVIRREVTAKECPAEFLEVMRLGVETFDYNDHGELLRPFFGETEIRKGESEAVVISFVLHRRGERHILVIDEGPARRFVGGRFPDLLQYLTGTVGFLEDAAMRKLFTPGEAIELLEAMLASNFRVDPAIVRAAIERLEGG